MRFSIEKPAYLLHDDLSYPVLPNEYLRGLENRSPKTVSAYVYGMVRFFDWCAARSVKWEEILPEELRSYRNSFSSATMVDADFGMLRRFFEFAARSGMPAPLNALLCPFDLTDKCGGYTKEIRLVSATSAWVFLEHLKVNPRNYWIARLMFLTGMRKDEVLRLGRELLTSPVNASGNVAFVILGKRGKERTLELAKEIRDELAAYADTAPGRLLFERNGKKLDGSTVTKFFAAAADATEIPIHPHLLRHMYATFRLEALLSIEGANAEHALGIVQSELGHSNIETTQRYLHIVNRRKAGVQLHKQQMRGMRVRAA